MLFVASGASAATLQVGPTRSYKTLGAVAGIVNPGDVVEVDGGATYPAVAFTRAGSAASKITLRGIRVGGKRPILSGGTNSIELAGDHYVLEGFEITGGSSRCVFHHADDITIRDSVVHDCPKQGILGADQDSGSLLLEYTEVYKCGGGTQDHQIYMATDEVAHPGSVFRMQFCWVHDGNGGNNVKTRAERNEIYYNWVEGAVYHELELIGPDPDGAASSWTEALKREDSDVVGNVLRKTGGSGSFARIGGDGTGQSKGRYRFVNNTFVSTIDTTALRMFTGLESVEMHNNVFFRTGGFRVVRAVSGEVAWVAGEQIAGSNNWVSTGSTFIPTQWTGTITGADPGLVASSYTVAAGSPLIDKGAATTAGPAGYAFPSPLAKPAFHPPIHVQLAPGTAAARPASGAIDIGAFEFGTATTPDDAGTTTDVGVVTDSATSTDSAGAPDSDTLVDANVATDSAGSDSGALEPASETADEGGCGCRTPRSTASSSALLPLLALLALVRRRR